MRKYIYKILPLVIFTGTVFASNYQDKEQLPVETTRIAYKFLANDYDGNPIDNKSILANLSRAILANTAYPMTAKKALCSKWSSEEKCAIRTGTYLTIDKDKIIVEYHNVKNSDGAITANVVESDIYNNISFTLSLNTKQEESYIIATITIPNMVEINSSNMISLTRYAPLDTYINLRKDLENSLNTDKVYLSQYHLETGEIDNQYTTDSVYGNLGRILGKYDWNKFPSCNLINQIQKKTANGKQISTSDIKSCITNNGKLSETQQKQQAEMLDDGLDINTEQMANTYRYKLQDTVIPINIMAYPYHNQSKAAYKAIIIYKMTSDGQMSVNKPEIESMVQYIESAIAN